MAKWLTLQNARRSLYMHIRNINSNRRYLYEQATLSYIDGAVYKSQRSPHKLQPAQNAAARVASRTLSYHHIRPKLQQYNYN